MSVFDDLFKSVLQRFLNKTELTAKFLQYHHRGSCKVPCNDCPERDKRIYENGNQIPLPAHPHCDCYYTNVETIAAGTISKRQPDPTTWLKMFGQLPDYYITKEEAMNIYGWQKGKNTIAGKAPGKMIGGVIYLNNKHILPEKEDREWKECDIDYEAGTRGSARLYYSNDGLIFYSPDHLEGNATVYLVE